jgi:hypothetical protein
MNIVNKTHLTSVPCGVGFVRRWLLFGSGVEVAKGLGRAYKCKFNHQFVSSITRFATGTERRLFNPHAVGTRRASPEEATTPKRIPTARPER